MTEARGPLLGVRVVELAGIGPGPFAGMLLADLGAEVISVERPGPPPREARFELLRRGRRSIEVDLATERGRDVVLDLVATADAFMEGFRPGVAERLGLGPDVALARNPGLVYGRMTGWGQTGPGSSAAGHDINYIARTGLLHAIGEHGGAPVVPVNFAGDYGGGGMLLALGIVSALFEAQRSGAGQVVDAAIVDGAAQLMASHWGRYAEGSWRDERGSNEFDGGAPHYGVYECAGGSYVSVGPLELKFLEPFLRRLGELTGLDLDIDHVQRPRWRATRRLFEKAFRSRSRDEWIRAFADLDACVSPVLTMSEAAVDSHLIARATYVDVGGVMHPSPAPRFSRTPSRRPSTPPERGAHTNEVLAELGRSDAEGEATLADASDSRSSIKAPRTHR
jgi:alpha-methylacyl-CoA racemase